MSKSSLVCAITRSSTSTNQSFEKLREKLSSVAWVQCDNKDCLKWRKISAKAAQTLCEGLSWTCKQNEDPNFQNCNVPEENTELFDRLARRAKLDLIKSELSIGTLVWAKIDGYCRWPALISKDPVAGEHVESDDYEPIYYHVEFTGAPRSHCWVQANRVEVFGTGNCALEDEPTLSRIPQADNSTGGTKKRKHGSSGKKVKGLGRLKVKKAVQEALNLLPLSPKQRLKTLKYIYEETKNAQGQEAKEVQGTFKKMKKKETRGRKKKVKSPSTTCHERHSMENKGTGLKQQPSPCIEDQIMTRAMKLFGWKRQNTKLLQKKKKTQRERESLKNGVDNSRFDLKTSLIGVSKTERFMLDVENYEKDKLEFQSDVSRFMLCSGLVLLQPPTWETVKVSFFSIYLAVYESGGYDQVCRKKIWSCLYSELTNNKSATGGSELQHFYKRNLYAYELCSRRKRYAWLIQELKESGSPRRQDPILKTEAEDTCSTVNSVSTKIANVDHLEKDLNEPELQQELDKLEMLLQNLPENKSSNGDTDFLVPTVNHDVKLICSFGTPISPEEGLTASQPGPQQQPEEQAQMVPELDFPSSTDESNHGENYGEHVLYEMQAMQFDIESLQDEIQNLDN